METSLPSQAEEALAHRQDIQEFRRLLKLLTGCDVQQPATDDEAGWTIVVNDAVNGKYGKIMQERGAGSKAEYAGMPPNFPRAYPGGPQHNR